MARLIDADALIETFRRGFTSDVANAVASVINDAPTVNAAPVWISVMDRLPENDEHVLCLTRTKKGVHNIVIGYYMAGAWRCGMNSNVTHWMPLPRYCPNCGAKMDKEAES